MKTKLTAAVLMAAYGTVLVACLVMCYELQDVQSKITSELTAIGETVSSLRDQLSEDPPPDYFYELERKLSELRQRIDSASIVQSRIIAELQGIQTGGSDNPSDDTTEDPPIGSGDTRRLGYVELADLTLEEVKRLQPAPGDFFYRISSEAVARMRLPGLDSSQELSSEALEAIQYRLEKTVEKIVSKREFVLSEIDRGNFLQADSADEGKRMVLEVFEGNAISRRVDDGWAVVDLAPYTEEYERIKAELRRADEMMSQAGIFSTVSCNVSW